MPSWVSVTIAIVTAIPKLKDAWDGLLAWYLKKKIDEMRADDREAIRKAVYEHDQRMLEKQIGNPTPGLPSGLPGTIIRDDVPPNVLPGTEKKRD